MSCGNPEAVALDGLPKEETLMPKKKTIDSNICIRCKERKGALVLRHCSYCKECLAPLLISKFSRVLIPHLPPLSSRPNTPTPSLLLACSGGSSSISLLEMFHRTFCVSASSKSRTGRARWGRIVVGFVDFGHEEKERAKERLRGIKELAEKFEWEFWRVGVEEAFDQTGELLSEDARLDGRVGINVSPGRVLETTYLPISLSYQTLLSHLPTSSHPSLRFHILSSLLNRMALSLSSAPSPTPSPPLLLTGLTSTRSASLVVSALASGRGYSLPLLVSSSFEERGVTVVRPLGGVGKKELAWYARERGLQTWDLDWDSGVGIGEDGKGGKSSIEALTQACVEDFIQTLNSTHPSTVSTISRTASKLIFPGYLPPSHDPSQPRPSSLPKLDPWKGKICPMCELPADPNPLEWLATTSITSLPSSAPPSEQAREGTVNEEGKRSMPLEKELCYACLTTLVSPSSASRGVKKEEEGVFAPLPAWVLGNLVGEIKKEENVTEDRRMGREEVGEWLRDEGWLLDQDEDEEKE